MITIETVAPATSEDAIVRIAKQNQVADFWTSSKSDKQIAIKMLVEKGKSQKILDLLQAAMQGKTNFRVVAYPLEVALPYESSKPATVSREALLNQLSAQAKLDGHFMMLVFLSTIVAAIGLIENNIAVIIGAMVIAPLLGPNLSLSLATTLGKTQVMFDSIKTLVAGIGFALGLSVLLGMFYPNIELSSELLARTYVGMDGLALALASGAAGALSITTGVSSVLVGVMVAVALLPPTVALGICLGLESFAEAKGAAMLLVANIASVNLTAQLSMRFKGIKPREVAEQKTALLIFCAGLITWAGIIAFIVYQLQF